MNAALRARIDELHALRDGWFHGGGRAPGGDFLDWLRDSLAAAYSRDIAVCEILPINNGGLRLNWFGPGGAFAADVYFPRKQCVVYGVNRNGFLEGPAVIDVSTGWRRVFIHVHDFCGGGPVP